MSERGFLIATDHLDGSLTKKYDVFTLAEHPIRFRLYDDDGVLYYSGRAKDEDAVEAAHNWGTYYAGTTRSVILNDDDEEEEFIS